MPRNHSPAGITPSILDRLTDLDPQSTREAPPSYSEQMRELKAALCRDLTALLNTRRLEDEIDDAYEECANSVLTFGVADFTAFNLKNGIEQERLRRSVERSVRRFEPRLARVTVLLEEPDPIKPILKFQISAVLRIDASAEPLLFDVTVHRDQRRIAVSGANP